MNGHLAVLSSPCGDRMGLFIWSLWTRARKTLMKLSLLISYIARGGVSFGGYGQCGTTIAAMNLQDKGWSRTMNKKAVRIVMLGIACSALVPMGGCVAVGVTALGIGMATGVSHTLGGIVYKTFSVPQAQLKKSTLVAMGRMQVKVVKTTRDRETELIFGKAGDRDVEVELEALTAGATRMSVTVKKDSGLLRDSATATEIILQTERSVGIT